MSSTTADIHTMDPVRSYHQGIADATRSMSCLLSTKLGGNDFPGLFPLNDEQAEAARVLHGKNVIAFGSDPSWYVLFFKALVHPFNVLLAILAIATILSGDVSGAVIMFTMVFISTVLRFWQESKSAAAAKSLKSLVSTMITVVRLYSCPGSRDPTVEDVELIKNHAIVQKDIPIEDVVPGDWVQLSAGDLIPADVKVIESKDLFVSQAALTGEAMPVEKFSSASEAMHVWKVAKLNPYEAMLQQAVPLNATAIHLDEQVRHTAAASTLKQSILGSIHACLGLRRFNPAPASEYQHVDLNCPDRCYMGTSVVSGTATVLVEKIGTETFFGSMAKELLAKKPESAFGLGVRNVSWAFFGLMVLMVPPVILLHGFVHNSWADAALFALSMAVGLTPEMLPMIVNSNLARGAYLMSQKRCITVGLDAIVNLGSMDVLCTDKTGTLTDNKVVLVRHLDYHGHDSIYSLQLAFLNARFQTGLKNLLDVAVVEYFEKAASDLPKYEALDMEDRELGQGLHPAAASLAARYQKLDEIPFDFVRRRMSVILQDVSEGSAMIVSKGAVEEMIRTCTKIVVPDSGLPMEFAPPSLSEDDPAALDTLVHPKGNQILDLTPEMTRHLLELNNRLNVDGIRVVAVAYRPLEKIKDDYGIVDECEMVFAGLVGFLDPPKDSAGPAIKELMRLGVDVKVLTGDSAAVCRKVCQEIGLPVKSVVSSEDLIGLEDEQVALFAEEATIFAKLTPLQKSQVIRSLKMKDHVVGFLGDGINDAPGLSEADIGISVDTATDIAKESADVIMLEKSLLVMVDAVLVGRKTYLNIAKYIVIAVSSNFGNVFSMLVASSWLPFLPMAPLHILVQNLLFDLSQTTIPWDNVDPEMLMVPHRWSTRSILRFMVFMGPWSSIFDITTFLFGWYYLGVQDASDPFKVTLFQTAWFCEGALTQTLVVHFLRSPKVPFFQSMAAWPLILSSLIVSCIILALPYIPVLADLLSLAHLPGVYYGYLLSALTGYFFVVQGAKMIYLRYFDRWF